MARREGRDAVSAIMDGRGHYLAAYRRRKEDERSGPDWLRRTREAAIGRFMERGFPTPREEDWKYTSVAAIEQGLFASPEDPRFTIGADAVERVVFGNLDGYLVVFVNGRFAPGLSRFRPLPAGANIGILSAALKNDPAALETYFSRLADVGGNGFTDLNTAMTEDGAIIHLSRGGAIDRPIHLVFATSANDRALMTHPHNWIVAEEGAQATVVEHYVGLGDGKYFTNAMTEIAAGPNASITHYKVQDESLNAYHIAAVRMHQERGSRFASHSASIGAALSRYDIDVVLDGEGAESVLNGLYLGDGRQHVDTHTLIDHVKPRGASRECYNGILNGQSRGVFHGRVVVHEDAQKTDARQSNKNLLLSREAEADSRPQLEIYADDVKCSHGSTVGQLDEEKIFYLRSRGIDEASARNLLAYAFASEVLDRFELLPVRRGLEAKLSAWLPEGQKVKEFHDETGT